MGFTGKSLSKKTIERKTLFGPTRTIKVNFSMMRRTTKTINSNQLEMTTTRIILSKITYAMRGTLTTISTLRPMMTTRMIN